MKLKSILLEMLTEVSFEQLKAQFVDTGKIDPELFNSIESSSNGKSAYATWLIKRVSDKMILPEDVYKWKKYFNFFDKYKNKFEIKDINLIKTPIDIKNLVIRVKSIEDAIESDPSKAGGSNKLEKYKEFYIGSVDGFSVFELPKGRKDLYGISCDLGSGTEWCTATGKTRQHFDTYIDQGPLFIFIKKGSDEKYQFSYESSQFMDKNDNSVI
jgi:hypothetical protein